LWTELGFDRDEIRFDTVHHGVVTVRRRGEMIELDFPVLPLEPTQPSDTLVRALGRAPTEVYSGMDLVCVFENKRDVHELSPDFGVMAQIEGVRAVAVTAPGAGHDYVCRLFAPVVGIQEDPFTGSLQCLLAPLWSEKLGKPGVSVHQVSQRGGEADCFVDRAAGRVRIAGNAVTYLRGDIRVS
jgi:predicted PhzF superfamily epimerase YddE/YHI9